MEILPLAEIFFSFLLGIVSKQFEFGNCKLIQFFLLHILGAFLNTMKMSQLAASKFNCFKTIASGKKNHKTESFKDCLLEISFSFSYLDFK
jgi:hypothetical protein